MFFTHVKNKGCRCTRPRKKFYAHLLSEGVKKMANVKEFIESEFVTAIQEWNGKEAVFIESPEFVKSDMFDKQQLVGIIESDKKRYKISVNKTNCKRLSKSWGEDTKEWLGKTILIEIATSVVKGDIKKTLVLTAKEVAR